MSIFWIPVLAGSLAAAACLIGAFYNLRRKRIIDDLPTSKTRGVFIGLAELKGTAESESPLTSYLAEIKCVHHTWKIEEQWRRTRTETYRDSKGHTHTRTRTETGWTRVADGGESGPFYLKDDTGVLRIIPDGAQIQAVEVFDKTVGLADPLYYSKGPARSIANSTHRRRFQETALPLHAGLYILGQARERKDVVAAEIAEDKDTPLYLISTRSEKQISSGYGRWAWILGVLGLIIAAGSGAGWAWLQRAGPFINWQPVIILAAGYLAIFIIAWVWTTYNSLINLHHRVEQGWSQVEIQLKRRHDLIPALVRTVEGYRGHESETQVLVTELRRQIEATPAGEAGPDYQGVAPLLRATIERYPDLKAGESFLKLQESLADTEERIALARDYYNDITTFYNTRLEIIPDRYAASIARLKPQALLSSSGFERAPVKVSLAE